MSFAVSMYIYLLHPTITSKIVRASWSRVNQRGNCPRSAYNWWSWDETQVCSSCSSLCSITTMP